jgi:hypothetical protein
VLQLDIGQIKGGIIQTLEAAVNLKSGPARLQSELKLDALTQMKRQHRYPDEVPFYLNLLNEAYEQRMNRRNATLTNSTVTHFFKVQNLQTAQTTQFLMRTRQLQFFRVWEQRENPFSGFEVRAIELCRSGFQAEYKGLIQRFQKFAEAEKLEITKDQFVPILYDRLTQFVTVSAYGEAHPELLEKDRRLHEMIDRNREVLFGRNAQQFLTGFTANPKLLELSAGYLERAFGEDCALRIAEFIDKALSSMVHVLSFQGFREIGADHWLPMALHIFMTVNPRRIASVLTYMHAVLLTLSDFGPISQSQEYNLTMAHSAHMFLSTELGKWEEAQGKES